MWNYCNNNIDVLVPIRFIVRYTIFVQQFYNTKNVINKVVLFYTHNRYLSCQVTIVGCYFRIQTTKINVFDSIDWLFIRPFCSYICPKSINQVCVNRYSILYCYKTRSSLIKDQPFYNYFRFDWHKSLP